MIKRIAPASAPFPTGLASNYAFSQPVVEGALRENVRAFPTVTVELGLPATNIQYCETARPTTYIVGPGMHRRWEFMVQRDETPAGIQQPAAIRALLSRWLAPHE